MWVFMAVSEIALIALRAFMHADNPSLAVGGAVFGLGAYMCGLVTMSEFNASRRR